jgi:hypothetical protein
MEQVVGFGPPLLYNSSGRSEVLTSSLWAAFPTLMPNPSGKNGTRAQAGTSSLLALVFPLKSSHSPL